MLHRVSIAGLTMDQASNTPILILKTVEGDESIPIWIGLLEAASITSALQNINFDRPMTHDLFKNFMDIVNIELAKVEVCDLKDSTFYARMYCTSGDKEFILDARPSDAISLALRFKAPIYVEEKVIKKSEMVAAGPEVADKSEEGKKWAEYLEKLSPEDFGKYKI
ncbi:MAG: bifunctional nuclease family protein [Deltaproteobacteria bacterium]|nr:bifunctional nuclease family protein [Deltaproteobacteria bacterium]MBW1940089.1 bifunctional nuclease family protein [Deltaproteobacteria bacterium]